MTKQTLLRILGGLIMCASFLLPQFAFADNETINAYTVHVDINKNGSVNVQEEIVYDFGPNAVNKHGIFREIPLQFTVPGEHAARQIEISSVMVTDGEGNLRQTQYRGGGNFVSLKIGEPDVTVSGPQLYVIRYTVWGALISLPDKDEFYWNATGDKWAEPILKAKAEVVLPEPVEDSLITHTCYAGLLRSNTRCESTTTPDVLTGKTDLVTFRTEGALPSHFGMTIAVGVPKGLLSIPEAKFIEESANAGILGGVSVFAIALSVIIPILTFIGMWRIWTRRGRDPKGRGTIVTAYDIPDHLGVLELAYLRKNNLPQSAITAGLIDLAVKGFLTIERVVTKKIFKDGEDFRLIFARETDPSKLSASEKILYNEFRDHGDSYVLSSVAHKLTGLSGKLEEQLAADLTAKGYYTEDPRKAAMSYYIAAVGLFFVGFFIPTFAVAIIASAIIIFIFAVLMPKKTEHGAVLVEEIEGFKIYLSVAEKDRIDFANAPDKDPKTFERFLPYAMVFGVEKAWATKFKDLYTEKESAHWYRGSGTFNATALAAGMGAFNTSAASAFAAKGGGSGGGGFSGGGGGGGGGGSW